VEGVKAAHKAAEAERKASLAAAAASAASSSSAPAAVQHDEKLELTPNLYAERMTDQRLEQLLTATSNVYVYLWAAQGVPARFANALDLPDLHKLIQQH